MAWEDHQREKLERLYRYAVIGDRPELAQLFRIERIEQVDAMLRTEYLAEEDKLGKRAFILPILSRAPDSESSQITRSLDIR